jgi:hypothetical protein
MKKLLLASSFFIALQCCAQNDVMMLEKNGERVKTFGPGVSIQFETIYQQWFQGTIDFLRNDTVYINGTAFNYKEIATIKINRKHLNYEADGAILVTAGAGVLLIGAINGLIRHDPASAWYTTTSYITSGALLLLGYLLLHSINKTYHLGKKFTLQYLALSAK